VPPIPLRICTDSLPAHGALLAALARTVDAQRPYAAIFARRELPTGRAMQSMRTFYRDDLEAAGLIARPRNAMARPAPSVAPTST
jgi:hypothetical protein